MPQTARIERAYRVRMYPKPDQARKLSRLFGARRFVWNWAINRKADDTAWLSELPRQPFDETLRDFDRGWTNFFAGRAKRSKRKRYMSVNSARFTLDQRRQQVDRDRGRVQREGIGKVRFRVTEDMAGRLRSVMVRRDSAGRWFASFTADQVPAPAARPAKAASIGIDIGLKDAAALSGGTIITAPKHLAAKPPTTRQNRDGPAPRVEG